MPSWPYLLPAVLAMGIAGAYFVQHSPRRAALATLRAATESTKRPTAPRPLGGAVPGRSQARIRSGSSLAVVAGKLVATVAGIARRLSPGSYLVGVQRRLTLSGQDRPMDAERFLALRLVTVLLVGPAVVVALVSPGHGLYHLLALILVGALLVLGPEAYLNQLIGGRKERIRHDLPAMLELLMISVEAGLGFDQALARAAGSVPGPLGEEFSRFLGEVRMGADHQEALEAIDKRTEVEELRSFLMALVQAETFGVSVGSILRSQAEQARAVARLNVQEQAQKAPVKMLFPLVFCVLPALFIVVVGPAAIEIVKTLGKVK